MLQCATASCSVLQRVAVCYSVLHLFKYHMHKVTLTHTHTLIALLFDKELVEPTNLILLMGLDAPPRDDAPTVDWRENELADAFVWASTHMVDIKMICRCVC